MGKKLIKAKLQQIWVQEKYNFKGTFMARRQLVGIISLKNKQMLHKQCHFNQGWDENLLSGCKLRWFILGKWNTLNSPYINIKMDFFLKTNVKWGLCGN
jgi:hypothetical protein